MTYLYAFLAENIQLHTLSALSAFFFFLLIQHGDMVFANVENLAKQMKVHTESPFSKAKPPFNRTCLN